MKANKWKKQKKNTLFSIINLNCILWCAQRQHDQQNEQKMSKILKFEQLTNKRIAKLERQITISFEK